MRSVVVRLTDTHYRMLEAVVGKKRRSMADTLRQLIIDAYERIKPKVKGENGGQS